jgi:hypothetical protein
LTQPPVRLTQHTETEEELVVKFLITLLVVVWLLIGVAAAAQRDYFSGDKANCAKFSTTAVTIVAGPLNYLGVNPKIKCRVPQPSE